ncbi:Succinylglutamate-semialdehyde dehydrogenase [Trema orientale]|uniref:Aldehyde dehydrogenase n=1 Tax=Trema orientale TaxID=63057 RepID=A0A2P5E2X2_TREOI|nr:Succinylglutamate-semialdehyde dehydrogenase [Trema orientale]
MSCSATLSLTAEVEEERKFDGDEASSLIKELQKVFNSGKTKSYEWRISQLQSIVKMLEEKEKDIIEAIHKDLAKPHLEAFIAEISTTKSSCTHALQELKHWIQPDKVNPKHCSARVGRIVMAAAAKHLTPVILELGGKCPAVVDSNINLQVASRRIITGKWALNNGQACIAVDYIITTKDFAPKLIDSIRNELKEFFGENPIESGDMSRIVSKSQFARLVKLLDEDKVSDKIVLGGQRDENKLRIAPTILLDVPQESEIMNEEIFGPLLPIITVDNLEESYDIIKSKPKPLVAYLFTNNDQLKQHYVKNVSSGGMCVNDTVTQLTVPGLPFGGVGESGMGSYHGKFSFDGFSHKKAVMYRSFDGDASVRYPPYTPQKERLLKALLRGDLLRVILILIGWSTDEN